eukprot:CAMPEP_0197247636 /NCGR_PEP_ID=MMETSP1429-20130617/30367_1 /TAXON_ID=49237 /ORGANISM="Chaetoceros  sp., Strain UNC1202" /LENGTH=131 /DNA_ID=CAMNT_0042708587 /DNA_START=52 /DNA_END=448 /DNA_ORIENTATION=+
MGKSILNRIDDMGDRIDNLEKSIGELMDVTDTQAMANTPTNIMTTAGSKIGSSSSSSVPYHHNTATTTTSNNSTHPQLLDAMVNIKIIRKAKATPRVAMLSITMTTVDRIAKRRFLREREREEHGQSSADI